MDLMKLGTQLIMEKLGENSGENPSENGIASALSGLLGGNSDGGIDFSSLIANVTKQGGGLENILGHLGVAQIMAEIVVQLTLVALDQLFENHAQKHTQSFLSVEGAGAVHPALSEQYSQ